MIINSLVAALLTEHLAECRVAKPSCGVAGIRHQRVVEILVGSCGVAVN
jgi:hypothetical protein